MGWKNDRGIKNLLYHRHYCRFNKYIYLTSLKKTKDTEKDITFRPQKRKADRVLSSGKFHFGFGYFAFNWLSQLRQLFHRANVDESDVWDRDVDGDES